MTAPTQTTGPRSKNELSLPALKSLGELADAKLIREIDSHVNHTTRHAKIARLLSVSRQQVTDWLFGRKAPALEQGLRLQAFLKRQRRLRT
jgi:hypothetical protein